MSVLHAWMRKPLHVIWVPNISSPSFPQWLGFPWVCPPQPKPGSTSCHMSEAAKRCRWRPVGFPSLRPSERRRFELMAGQPPFESPNPMQIFARILHGLRKARSRTRPSLLVEARAFGNEAKLPFCRFFGRVHLFLVVILEGNQKEAA